LDEALNRLGTHNSTVSMIGCFLILVCMLAVFFTYMYFSRRQMAELASAQKEAEYANKAKSEFLSKPPCPHTWHHHK
ncbi:MAG TPA: hypothetical protein VK097_13695, partial [Lentibacillus sp.]|uniref:hypothetical protein n=1 Tax=Lentibacillus sp. TaxID=1925746 RepID=UPI002B4AAF5A